MILQEMHTSNRLKEGTRSLPNVDREGLGTKRGVRKCPNVKGKTTGKRTDLYRGRGKFINK